MNPLVLALSLLPMDAEPVDPYEDDGDCRFTNGHDLPAVWAPSPEHGDSRFTILYAHGFPRGMDPKFASVPGSDVLMATSEDPYYRPMSHLTETWTGGTYYLEPWWMFMHDGFDENWISVYVHLSAYGWDQDIEWMKFKVHMESKEDDSECDYKTNTVWIDDSVR